jgi:hypothetical protein
LRRRPQKHRERSKAPKPRQNASHFLQMPSARLTSAFSHTEIISRPPILTCQPAVAGRNRHPTRDGPSIAHLNRSPAPAMHADAPTRPSIGPIFQGSPRRPGTHGDFIKLRGGSRWRAGSSVCHRLIDRR